MDYDLDAAAARVRAAYAAGVPLFARAALVALAAVLDADDGAVRAGVRAGSVTLVALDGRRVRQTTRVGEQKPVVDKENGLVVVLANTRPRIEYWPLQRLTGRGRWHARHFDAARACLALRLGHETEARAVLPGGQVVVRGPTAGAVAAVLARRAAGLADPRPAAAAAATQPDTATLSAWFAAQRTAWMASPACARLRTLLATWPAAVPVRSVVALGCGRLTAEEAEHGQHHAYHRRRAAAQHALALTLADLLGQDGPEPVTVVAQDPAYTADDRAVLAAAGIAVVDDPHGFLAVDAAAVVVAVAPAVAVAQVVADVSAPPAGMLWQRVRMDEDDDDDDDPLYDLGGADNPPSTRVRALVRGYTAHAFDGGPLFGTVEGLALYVRRTR